MLNYGYDWNLDYNVKGFSQSYEDFSVLSSPTYICRVYVKIRVRVKSVKRIPTGIRRDHYAIEKTLTSANMTMIEFDK